MLCGEIFTKSGDEMVRVLAVPATDPSCDVVLMTYAESESMTSFNDLFVAPAPADIQAAFVFGASMILVAYMSAWFFGVVINFVKRG